MKTTMAPSRRSFHAQVDGPPRSRHSSSSNRTRMEAIKIDMNKCNLSKDLAHDRSEWTNRIHIADLNIIATRL